MSRVAGRWFALIVCLGTLASVGFIGFVNVASGGAQIDELIRALPPPMPTSGEVPALPAPLREIIGAASDDGEALTRIVAYFDEHEAALAAEFGTTNRDETAAVYAMYIVHMAVPYGAPEGWPESLVSFAWTQQYMHCGISFAMQLPIANALGLHARLVQWESGDHVWMEVRIDGRWQIFDSTTDLWIDGSMLDLVQGAARTYHQFYQSSDIPNCEACRPEIEPGHRISDIAWQMVHSGIDYLYWSPPVAESDASEA